MVRFLFKLELLMNNTQDSDSFLMYLFVQTVREAALMLGYNQQAWDQGLDIKELDVYWEELSDEFKAAALKLGYDKTKWNAS